MESIEKLVSKIISYLFHPVLITFYGTLILFNLDIYVNHIIPTNAKILILALIFFHTSFIPVFLTFIIYKTGYVSSFEMDNRKERTIPYVVGLIFYIICFYLLRKYDLPAVITHMVLAASITIFLTMLINLFWKISAHMIGIGGLCGALYGIGIVFNTNVNLYFISAILISGLLGFARLRLEAHNPLQVYTGYALGFICQMITIIILL